MNISDPSRSSSFEPLLDQLGVLPWLKQCGTTILIIMVAVAATSGPSSAQEVESAAAESSTNGEIGNSVAEIDADDLDADDLDTDDLDTDKPDEVGVGADVADVEPLPQESVVDRQPNDAIASSDTKSRATRVRVKLPLAGSSDIALKQVLQQIAEKSVGSSERPIVVLEFWAPSGGSGSGSEFERSLSLARFLTGPAMQGVRTVAYIPRTVTGHAVLAVLACEQIMMAPEAELGDAGERDDVIGPTIRGSYGEISRSRRTVPEAIALGMLDSELEVFQVDTDSGTLYAWPDELKRIRESRNDLQSVTTLVPAGEPGRFRGEDLRRMGFVSHLVSDQAQLAQALGISVDDMEFDPSQGEAWRAIRVDIAGPISAQTVERVMRTVQQQSDVQQINFVCLQVDSPGGSIVESTRLANFLADLDASRIRTVAYVPREARGDAALVAFACDHVVVHSNAIIGGGGATQITAEEASDLRPPIEQIAERKNKNWSIMAAIVDADLAVHRYSKDGVSDAEYMCVEEYGKKFGADGDGVWKKGEPLTMPDEVLRIDGGEAERVGFARFVVDSYDELQQLYQLAEQPTLIGPNWAFDVVDALASPQLAGLLLFIGGFALMSELSAPGLGVGGFLAAVCFMLFFWSNFLHGTAEVLEVMLFLTGLACLAVEVFVIPGFGIFGLGGAGLVLASLVLASQTFVVPTNDYQMQKLSQSMLTVAMAGAGVFSAAIMLRKYMHRLPWLGNIMLLPPSEEEKEDQSLRESVAQYQHLVGATGIARTQMTPSGKAKIGDLLFHVISEGEVIDKGAEIEVMEVWGNRIIVRERTGSSP